MATTSTDPSLFSIHMSPSAHIGQHIQNNSDEHQQQASHVTPSLFSKSMNQLVSNLMHEQSQPQSMSMLKRGSIPSIITSVDDSYPQLIASSTTSNMTTGGPDLTLLSPTSASFFKAATEQIDNVTSTPSSATTGAVPRGPHRPSPLRYNQVLAESDVSANAPTPFMSVKSLDADLNGGLAHSMTFMPTPSSSTPGHNPIHQEFQHTPQGSPMLNSSLTPSNANSSSGAGFPHLPYISPLLDTAASITSRSRVKSMSVPVPESFLASPPQQERSELHDNGTFSQNPRFVAALRDSNESKLATPSQSCPSSPSMLMSGLDQSSNAVNPTLLAQKLRMQSFTPVASPALASCNESAIVGGSPQLQTVAAQQHRTARSHSLSGLSIFTPFTTQHPGTLSDQNVQHYGHPMMQIRTAMDFTTSWDQQQPPTQDPFAASAPAFQHAAFPHLPHPSQPTAFFQPSEHDMMATLPDHQLCQSPQSRKRSFSDMSSNSSPLLSQEAVEGLQGDDAQAGKKKKRGPRPKTNVRFICQAPGCGIEFQKYSLLKAHSETHNMGKPKPFQCQMCPQSFSRSHDLKRHYYVHTNNKPFSCTRCGKGFSRIDALKRHEKSVADGRKVHCVPMDQSMLMSGGSFEDNMATGEFETFQSMEESIGTGSLAQATHHHTSSAPEFGSMDAMEALMSMVKENNSI